VRNIKVETTPVEQSQGISLQSEKEQPITHWAIGWRPYGAERIPWACAFADVFQPADPGHAALDSHPETAVRHRAVLAQIDVPLEGLPPGGRRPFHHPAPGRPWCGGGCAAEPAGRGGPTPRSLARRGCPRAPRGVRRPAWPTGSPRTAAGTRAWRGRRRRSHRGSRAGPGTRRPPRRRLAPGGRHWSAGEAPASHSQLTFFTFPLRGLLLAIIIS